MAGGGVSAVDQFSLGGSKFSEPSGTREELPVSTYFECSACRGRFPDRGALEAHLASAHRPKTSPYPDEVREEALRLVGEGLSDSEAARRVRVNGSTVRRWRIASADKGADTPAPAGGSALSPEPQPAKDGASIGRPGPAWRGSQTFQGWDFGGEVSRADFTRLLLLAVRCQKHAEGEAETSCYADRDPERLADLALSIAARMLGLQLPDEEEGSP